VSTSKSGVSRRGEAYHHGNLRQALVTAARDLLKGGDPAAVTLREAARLAGVSHNAPYRHFAGREALLAAVAAEGFEDLRRGLAAALADTKPERRLNGLGQAYIRFAVTHRSDFRLMFGSEVRAALHPELQEAALGAFSLLRDAAGPHDASAVLRAWGTAHGLAHLVANGQVSLEAALGALD
jgi:AcrR family transcriptional regulator